MIITDTREQKPLWEMERRTLSVGDYTTPTLDGLLHIERKSPNDLYGSITHNHKRFRAMLLRAQEQNITIVIVVETTEEKFLRKDFPGGYRCTLPGNTLAKILHTIKHRYKTEIVWCDGRREMRRALLETFRNAEEALMVLGREDEITTSA